MFMMTKQKIFTPIKIGNVELRNRIAMPPMSTRLSNTDGSVTPRVIKYYEERAKGGVGMIIVEYSYIDEDASKAAVCQLGAQNDNLLPGLSELSEAIKAHGAKAFLQICHGGGQSPSGLIKRKPVAPSAISPKAGAEIPLELTIDEIQKIVRAFGDAALRAKKAGFNGVEIHGAHGYLLNQFLSPRFNKRTDAYGPDFKSRARFALEIVDEIRGKVGKEYPVGFRLNVSDYMPDGIQPEETKELVKMLEAHGVSYIHASAGTYESHQYMIPPTYIQRGHLAHLAREIKSVVNIPVISVGGINHEVAPQIIEKGDADVVAIGRALVADPELPNKMLAGRNQDVRPCIRCNDGCIGRFFAGETMRCATNSAAGRESAFEIHPADRKKKVMIIGGGLAGMEIARIASLKGHQVVLLEKSNKLGGNALVASVPEFKQEIRKLIEWFENQLQALPVEVQLNTEATSKTINSFKPDVLINAVGAKHIVPDVKGVESAHVMTASEVLTGDRLPKGNVVIVGGGLVGIETAIYLAQQNKTGGQGLNLESITALEMQDDILLDAVRVNKLELNQMIARNGIKTITGGKALAINADSIEYVDKELNIKKVAADSVVLAVGFRPNEYPIEKISDKIPVYSAGDCKTVGKIIDAINSAALLAINI